MAKTRVHELAKQYNVESKFVLEKLKEMGEFVKSPSSTIELPVEMRFKKEYGDQLKSVAETSAPAAPAEEKPAAKKAPAKKSSTAKAAAKEAEAEPEAVEAPAEPAARGGGSGRRRGARGPGRTGAAGRARGPGRRVATPTTPKAPAPRPVGRPGAPRPGNNPFASSQGMGRRPAPRPGTEAAGSDAVPDGQRPPRPPAEGRPGMPRPNPAMMPKSPAAFGGGPGGRGPGGPGRGGPGGAGGPGRTGAPSSRWRARSRWPRWPRRCRCRCPRSSRRRFRRWRSARWRSSRPAWPDPGCLRSPRRPLAPWPQVEAGPSSRVRGHGGPDDRRRARPQGQRRDRPAAPRCLADRLRRPDRRRRGPARADAVQPRRDGDRDRVGQRRDARAAR